MVVGLRVAGTEMSLIRGSIRYLRAYGLAYRPVENQAEYRRPAAACGAKTALHSVARLSGEG